MDAPHGITFTDYAATNAFLAQGKSIDELLPTLGVDSSQWGEAKGHWEDAMSKDLEFKLAMELGEVFKNPAVGKYAGAATQTMEDAAQKIPDVETWFDLQGMMSVGMKYGLDPNELLAEHGLTAMDFSQASMALQEELQARLADESEEGLAYREYTTKLHDDAEAKYEERFGG